MRDYLALEKNDVVVNGRIEEAIYIGTDTRYNVAANRSSQPGCTHAKLWLRVMICTFNVGDQVYVHWAAENAQILDGVMRVSDMKLRSERPLAWTPAPTHS